MVSLYCPKLFLTSCHIVLHDLLKLMLMLSNKDLVEAFRTLVYVTQRLILEDAPELLQILQTHLKLEKHTP